MTARSHQTQDAELGDRASHALDVEARQDADDISNRVAGERWARLMDALWGDDAPLRVGA